MFVMWESVKSFLMESVKMMGKERMEVDFALEFFSERSLEKEKIESKKKKKKKIKKRKRLFLFNHFLCAIIGMSFSIFLGEEALLFQ